MVAYCNSVVSLIVSRECWVSATLHTETKRTQSLDSDLQAQVPTNDKLQEEEDTFVMILVQLVDVPLDIKTLVAFFDSGSNVNIIWMGWAEEAGLEDVPVIWTVYTVGGDCKE